jgi:hypothetical protein
LSQADEEKQPLSARKIRRRTQDLADKEDARLSQAEQLQGQINPNPDSSLLPNPNYTLVGANIQSVSSANAYQSDTTRNSGDTILNLDLGRQGAVTGDGESSTMISRLERLNHVRSVAFNKQKLSRALEILQSQEDFSLLDPNFIAVGLEEFPIDQVIEMYEQHPLPVRMKDTSMLLTQVIKRLNRGYTEQHAVQFVQWVRNTDSGLSISQLVDQHAKFTLDCKFRSMAHRFDRTPKYFIGW